MPGGTDLRMFQAKEGLWFATPDGGVCSTHLSAAELLPRLLPTSVRLYGTASQAAALVQVFQAGRVGLADGLQLYVGSPGELRGKDSPAEALQRMTSLYSLSPYFGGWRQLGLRDFSGLCFLEAGYRGNWEDARIWLPRLPGLVPCEFLNPDTELQLKMLYTVEDPRWFHRDVNHPERESKLRTFLGVTPSNVRSVAAGRSPRGCNWRRFELLMLLLFGAVRLPEPLSKVKPLRCLPAVSILDQYRQTLSAEKALQGTLDLGVSFLRRAWLQELAPPGREVFVAGYFFETLGRLGKTLAKSYEKLYRQLHPVSSG